jgi:glucan phosphoethanolaminetransferase (alkaline phosphatase superfamily)
MFLYVFFVILLAGYPRLREGFKEVLQQYDAGHGQMFCLFFPMFISNFNTFIDTPSCHQIIQRCVFLLAAFVSLLISCLFMYTGREMSLLRNVVASMFRYQNNPHQYRLNTETCTPWGIYYTILSICLTGLGNSPRVDCSTEGFPLSVVGFLCHMSSTS